MTADHTTPSAPEQVEHDCATCEACLHNGHKCCGCYDGACCQPAPVPDDEAEALAEMLWAREFRAAPRMCDEPEGVQQGFREDAAAILASDWLAKHTAAAVDAALAARGRGQHD